MWYQAAAVYLLDASYDFDKVLDDDDDDDGETRVKYASTPPNNEIDRYMIDINPPNQTDR